MAVSMLGQTKDIISNENISVKGIIKIFYYCNSYCVFCHSEDNKVYKANLKKAKQKIDWALSIGINQILFSGGEPTIYSGFEELVRYAVSKGLSTGIISNGRTLSQAKMVYFLLQQKASYFYLSLHGYTAKLNDEITESPGSWQEAVTGFKNLIHISNELDITIDLTINCVLTQENISSAQNMVEFLHSIGIRKMKFSYPQSKGRAKEGNITWGIPTIEDSVKTIESCIDLGHQLGIKVFHDGIPFCFFNQEYRLLVENLQTHRIFYMIEIFEKKWFETDEGPREKINECKLCSFNSVCNGVLEKSKYHKINPIEQPIPNYFSLFRVFTQKTSETNYCLKEDEQVETKSLPQRRIFIQQQQEINCYEAEHNFFTTSSFRDAKQKDQLFYLPSSSDPKKFSIFDLLKIKRNHNCNNCDEQCPGLYSLSTEPYNTNLDPLEKYLNSLKGQGTILEVGCGELLLTKQLVDENYYALEPNQTNFEKAQKENPLGNFFHKDIESFSFEDNYFDTVLLIGSYNHIKDLNLAINKMYLMMKSKAKIIIVENKVFGLLTQEPLPAHNKLVTQWGHYEHHRNHSVLQAQEILLENNFSIKNCGDIKNNNNFWYIEAVK